MARSVLICSIVFGCIAIVGGLLFAGWAFCLMPGPTKEEAPSPPSNIKLTKPIIEKWEAEHTAELRELERDALTVDEPGTIPARLISLFPAPFYSTIDIWESYCKTPSEYGCLEKSKRLKVPNAARVFSVLFKDIDERTSAEWISVLFEQLPKVEVEKRLSRVAPTIMGYLQVKKQNQDAVDAYEAKLKEIDETFAAENAAHRDKAAGLAVGGLSAAAWGFGAVVSASIFVALLAIERHLRELRRRQDG